MRLSPALRWATGRSGVKEPMLRTELGAVAMFAVLSRRAESARHVALSSTSQLRRHRPQQRRRAGQMPEGVRVEGERTEGWPDRGAAPASRGMKPPRAFLGARRVEEDGVSDTTGEDGV